MEQLFIASTGKLKDRWLAAFSAARIKQTLPSLSASDLQSIHSIWVDITGQAPDEWLPLLIRAVATGKAVAVLSPVPSEEQAIMALGAGARAYCHSETAPIKLKEVGDVLGRGGVWLPPNIMKRLLDVSLRVLGREPQEPIDLSELTAREISVAEKVATGASNREISRELEISERTVKAHLSSIFAKLGVRDRVQLALAFNNVITHFPQTR